MKQSILDDGITGKIQSELWRLGFICDVQRLTFFTDKPLNEKTINLQKRYSNTLDAPYMTSFTYKKACVFYEKLKEMKVYA